MIDEHDLFLDASSTKWPTTDKLICEIHFYFTKVLFDALFIFSYLWGLHEFILIFLNSSDDVLFYD